MKSAGTSAYDDDNNDDDDDDDDDDDNNNNNNNNNNRGENAKFWHTRKVIVVPVVIGALGAVSVNFIKYMKQVGVKVSLEVIQKTALLGTAKILRKVPSL